MLVAVLGCGCVTAPEGIEPNWGQQILVVGGYRGNDSGVSGNPVVGLELVRIEPTAGGWGFEIEGRYGTEEEDQVDKVRTASYYEIGGGIRQVFNRGAALRPYVGVGGAYMIEDTDDILDNGLKRDQRERGGGAYAHGGALWIPSETQLNREWGLALGVDLRGMWGEDYCYTELSFVVGIGR